MVKTAESRIDQDVEKFERLYFAGSTPTEISIEFGVTKTSVYAWMRRHGYSPINPEKQKIAREMYDRGADDGEIAAEINIHMSNVKNWREKNGLKKRVKRKVRM